MRRVRLARRKRGLSSVVGAVFLVLVVIAGFNLIVWGIQQHDGYSMSLIDRGMEDWKRMNEQVEITSARIDQNRFNLTVLNKGSLTAHIVRLWVTNESASPRWHDKFDLSIYINPGETVSGIGQSLGVIASSSNTYALKIVTERGNKAEFKIFSPSDAEVGIDIMGAGYVLLDQRIRLVVLITNNSTIPSNLVDVVPIMSATGSEDSPKYVLGPTPSSVDVLREGRTAVFYWEYDAPQKTGILTFNASFVGAPSGTYKDITMEVITPAEAEQSGISRFADAAKHLGLLISGIPSPVDAETGGGPKPRGKYGVGIVNPLNRTIEVYSVAFVSTAAELFKVNPVGIKPTTGWRKVGITAEASMIIWEGGDNPVIIPAFSMGEFIMEEEAKLDKVYESPVIVEALTSEGKFFKTHALTQSDKIPTINLFYTKNADDPLSDWGFMNENIKGGVPTTFNATLEVLGDDNLTSSIKVVILVPASFKNVTVASQPDWQNITIDENPDGSSIITARTVSNTITPGTMLLFQFTVTPEVPDHPLIWVMLTTTVYPEWGAPEGTQIASAVSETAVQVVP